MSLPRHYRGKFWIGMAVSFMATWVWLLLWGHIELFADKEFKPRPPFIFPGTEYMSSTRRGDVDQLMFIHGLLGMDKKIKSSDIILMGTSHMEFDVNSQLLSKLLKDETGHNYRIINLGRGHADGAALSKLILERNNIKNKIVIIDLYEPLNGDFSEYAKTIKDLGTIPAYYKLIDATLNYTVGLLKDLPRWPRIIYEKGRVRLNRLLDRVIIRNSVTQDVDHMWGPYYWDVLSVSHPPTHIAEKDLVPVLGAESVIETMGPEWCAKHHLHCIYTLLPYGNAKTDAIPALVAKYHLPYAAISGNDMSYFDDEHADERGREMITQILALQLNLLLNAPKK